MLTTLLFLFRSFVDDIDIVVFDFRWCCLLVSVFGIAFEIAADIAVGHDASTVAADTVFSTAFNIVCVVVVEGSYRSRLACGRARPCHGPRCRAGLRECRGRRGRRGRRGSNRNIKGSVMILRAWGWHC